MGREREGKEREMKFEIPLRNFAYDTSSIILCTKLDRDWTNNKKRWRRRVPTWYATIRPVAER